MTGFAQSTLHQLLVHPPQSQSPAARNPTRHSDRGSPVSEDDLRIAKTKPAGDVLHIFSHIRKTYRVQWILLVGSLVNHSLPQDEAQQLSDDPRGGSASADPLSTTLPPALRSSSRPYTTGSATRPEKPTKSKQANVLTAKRKKLIAADSVQESTRLEAMWVRMDDVPDVKCVFPPLAS